MTTPLTAPTTGPGLLAAILEHPEDDFPRLLYADWLDEQGEGARAEFVWVQVELAGVMKTCPCHQCALARGASVCEPTATKCSALRRREQELHTPERLAAWLPEGLTIFGTPCVWRRGFIESVRLPAAAWRDEILDVQPVTRVEFTEGVIDNRGTAPLAVWRLHVAEVADQVTAGIIVSQGAHELLERIRMAIYSALGIPTSAIGDPADPR